MKFTIEHEKLNATTGDLDTAFSLLNLLNTPFSTGISLDNAEDADEIWDEPFDITADKYLVITADDIFLNDESTETYNGQKIWEKGDVIEDFRTAQKKFKPEHNIDVAELHVLQSSTAGEYATAGRPVPDKNGFYAWCRIKTRDGRLSSWVFNFAFASGGGCAARCAANCAADVQGNAPFRSALFSGLGD